MGWMTSQPKSTRPTMSNSEPATALETLGTFLYSVENDRDAVHLAVVRVTAPMRLFPGQHVAKDGTPNGELVGIVDPFLPGPVQPDQQFWLVLYPRTITSLRHAWTHPAFAESVDAPVPTKDDKSYSEEWMRRWADKHVSTDYYGDGDKVSSDAAYAFALNAGRDHNIGPYEDARDHIDDEWWSHWEILTGERGDRGEYFRCAC
jgi:hypothetical protein